MEEALLALLAADAGVAALLADRIAWGARPTGEQLPCVVLFRITGVRDYHLQGRSGLVDSLVQVDCWAGTWLAAKSVARAIVDALDTPDQPTIQKAFVEGERDSFEEGDGPLPDGSSDFYRTSLDVRVWHADGA